ncbi:MAG: tungstate ABC transporter substrate-binding protein WtpA [Methanomicrobiaceae archaeon]|nr:tungstate ABC transporter substrate-binding protein WtpA [Methanomicrobiaceae archaeon]
MNRTHVVLVLAAILCTAVFFCGCTGTETEQGQQTPAATATPTATATSVPAEETTLVVYHAGSLTSPFEALKAEFEAEYPHVDVQLRPGGSTAIVKEIVELDKHADVLASADYALIPSLMVPDDAEWYVTFAKNTMVLAYTDQSLYADEINADNWYEILARDDVRWAFSDPNLDPCGYRTPMVIQLAELHYGDDQIFENTIGANSNITVTEEDGVYMINSNNPEPTGQLSIRPKSVELVQMVQAGGIDYAWEYRSVAVQNDLNFVELPEAIDLSSIEYADTYALVKEDCGGGIKTASPIVYGVTVPTNADNPEIGLAFVEMLIGETGQTIMDNEGQPPIVPSGGFLDVPEDLGPLVEQQS